MKNAQLFIEQNEYVPTYLKLGNNQWIYKGEFKVDYYSDKSSYIENHRKHRLPSVVSGILFLEKKV